MINSYNSIILKGEFKASIDYIVNLRPARGIETLFPKIKSIVLHIISIIIAKNYLLYTNILLDLHMTSTKVHTSFTIKTQCLML